MQINIHYLYSLTIVTIAKETIPQKSNAFKVSRNYPCCWVNNNNYNPQIFSLFLVAAVKTLAALVELGPLWAKINTQHLPLFKLILQILQL